MLGSDHSVVLIRDDATDSQRCRPTGAAERELDEPGVVPASDDGLTVRVAIWMVIVPALRTRFRVAARPDARIDGILGGWGMLRFQHIRRHERFQPQQIRGSGIERVVETGSTPVATRSQTQVGRCFQGNDRQHSVKHLEQCIAPTPEYRVVDLLMEGSQRFPFWCVHVQKNGRTSLFLSTRLSPTSGYWLKCKLRTPNKTIID